MKFLLISVLVSDILLYENEHNVGYLFYCVMSCVIFSNIAGVSGMGKHVNTTTSPVH